MAQEAALPFVPGGEDAPKPAADRRSLIVGVAVVTLLSVAAGAGTAFLIANPAPAPEEETAAAIEPVVPAAYAGETGTLTLVPLQPIITNISQPTTAVIRIEASLVLRAEAEADPEVLAAQIGADTLAFARSLELAQIEGARGLQHLREDLKERAALRSPAVADFIIHSLVAQ